jgi:hypothetical protein
MCGNRRDEKQAFRRRLVAAGCPIDADLGPDELKIMQDGEAQLQDLGTGHVAVLFYIVLVREEPGQIVVKEFGELVLPWGPVSVVWLSPQIGSSRALYKLPNGWSFERDRVLNDKLSESGIRLRHGQHVEGYVLGYSKTTIPEMYKHGVLLQAQFSVIDVVGREYHGDVVFFVDRKGGRISLPKVRPGAALYEPCDPPEKSIEDPSASARQRLGDPVRRQDHAVAEAKVLRNSKEHFPPPLGTPWSA